jgi:hypothetical protein
VKTKIVVGIFPKLNQKYQYSLIILETNISLNLTPKAQVH